MSILIDEFITKTKGSNITEGIDGAGTKWYIAKPLSKSLTPKDILSRCLESNYW